LFYSDRDRCCNFWNFLAKKWRKIAFLTQNNANLGKQIWIITYIAVHPYFKEKCQFFRRNFFWCMYVLFSTLQVMPKF
jgi:hypothetical protein